MHQIVSLLKRGVDVQIFALNKAEEEISEDFKKYGIDKRTHYINIPNNKIYRFLKALKIFLQDLPIAPFKIIKSLNFISYKKIAFSLIPLYVMDYFLRFNQKFDIIHCHFGQRGIYGSCLKDAGIEGKLVTSFYGGDLSAFIRSEGPEVYKNLFKLGDLFLPLSKNFRDELIKLGCPEEKIKILPIGIDTSKLNFIKRPEDSITTIICIARFVEKKGHKYLIKAISQVIKKNENVRCILVGDGPLMDEIKKISSDLRIDKFVEFTGSVNPDKLPEFYGKSDIFVLASVKSSKGDMEGTPVVLIEAQAAGLPVVSTYHSGIPEIVKDNITGYLVNEKDIKGLADKISYLISNPSKRTEMGKEGRKNILKNYDRNALSKKLLRFYEGIIE